MIDLHLHTARCCHASGTMQEYVEAARSVGLKEIGFADHFPLGLLGVKPRVKVSMEPRELEGYIKEINRLKATYSEMTIKVGIEVDYIPGLEMKTGDLLSCYPFDYVIGSLHFMEDWDFTHPKYADDYQHKDIEELYRCFFDLTAELAASGLFDVIGHVDVIKKFGYRPQNNLEDLWQEAAEHLKNGNLCLELNTAGKDAPVGVFYPDQQFLRICCEKGVPATLGSDAHAPDQVGRHLNEGLKALKSAGYKEVATFMQRERKMLPLL